MTLVPKHVFLDTNIFDSQHYHFESAAFKTFTTAAKEKGVELLLPHPTDLEIQRHIRDRSEEALEALHKAKRAAPFLRKWEHFPKDTLKQTIDYDIVRVAGNEWHAFKKQFTVHDLDYVGVSTDLVMRWYDRAEPPFGLGKKRKEFPDAFAIAILDVFVRVNEVSIGVVSSDPDMHKACESRPRFLTFRSLPELTEVLVLGSEQVDAMRELILADTELLDDAILNEVSGTLSYYHEHSSHRLIESVEEGIDIEDVRVVGMGRNEATLAFEALISTNHYMEWEEEVWDDEYRTARRHVIDTGTVHGVAKVELDTATKRIAKVVWTELEELELPVTETPTVR